LGLGQFLLKLLDFLHVFFVNLFPQDVRLLQALDLLGQLLHRLLQGVEVNQTYLCRSSRRKRHPRDANRGHQTKHQAACFHCRFHSWFK